MSRQREALPKILAIVKAQFPDAAIYLSGSVALGNERPDSDLDIYVVVPDLAGASYPGGTLTKDSADRKAFSAECDGVPAEITFLTTSFFDAQLRDKPWRGYKAPLRSEILSDPHGFLQSWKDRLRPWFQDHPEAVALWEQWIAEYAESRRTRGANRGELIRRFPYAVPHLWPHLDGLYSQAGPAGGDPV